MTIKALRAYHDDMLGVLFSVPNTILFLRARMVLVSINS